MKLQLSLCEVVLGFRPEPRPILGRCIRALFFWAANASRAGVGTENVSTRYFGGIRPDCFPWAHIEEPFARKGASIDNYRSLVRTQQVALVALEPARTPGVCGMSGPRAALALCARCLQAAGQ